MRKKEQIFRLSGGLGNQFFSFAAAYQCCKERGEALALDVSTQEAPWFFRDFDLSHYAIEYDRKISYRLGDKWYDHLLLNHIFRRTAIGLFTPTLTEKSVRPLKPDVFNRLNRKTYIVGDWQREFLFKNYEDDIRRMYVYRGTLSDGATKWMEEIQKEKSSIAVHARRGDYVQIGCTLGTDYYKKAIELMAEKVDDPFFFCFSEDLEWLRDVVKDLPYQFRFVDYDSDQKGIEDFELMRACGNQIVANSTYSWWAAWLNDCKEKTVVRPSTHNKDFWPAEWLQVNG